MVTRDVPPTPWPGATPARPLKPRFDPELTQLLLAFRWWDLPSKELAATLPLLCEEDLEKVRQVLCGPGWGKRKPHPVEKNHQDHRFSRWS